MTNLTKCIITTRIRIEPGSLADFADWQGKLHSTISRFPGFVSLEILSQSGRDLPEWTISQRFNSTANAKAWENSEQRRKLLLEFRALVLVKKDLWRI